MMAIPASATEAALQAIEQRNPSINALVHLDASGATAQARLIEERAAEGGWSGLLAGVPIVVKDCVDVAGMPSSDGMPAASRVPVNLDSAAAGRMRSNGAIFLGKSNLSELAYSVRNDNRFFGDCFNPWDLERIPGGSSGGSAAAVASGMCRIALGTDTGGSIRIPAALCGIAGLRPTAGRVPNEGLHGLSIDFDTIGPMAYSVGDVAVAYAVLAGEGGTDAPPLENFLPTLHEGVRGIRIGLPKAFYFDQADDSVAQRVQDAARVLESCGAVLSDVVVPRAGEAQENVTPIIAAEAVDLHLHRIEQQPESIEKGVMDRLKIGLAASGRDYARCRRWLAAWMLELRALFQTVDVLLTPTTPTVAPRFTDAANLIAATRRLTSLTYGFSATGRPGLSVPCGFAENGMPVGMLLTGRPFEDPLLLRAGLAYQAVTDFHHARPSWSS